MAVKKTTVKRKTVKRQSDKRKLVKRSTRGSTEIKAAPPMLPIVPSWQLGQPYYYSPVYLNFVREGLKKSALIYACTTYIADAVARAYLRFNVRKSDGEEVPLERHEVVALWDRPNKAQSQTQFIQEVVTHLLLAGNAYAWKWRARNGKVLGLWLLRPDRIKPQYGKTEPIEFWIYTVNGKKIPILPEDIIHFPLGVDGENPLLGLSPMVAAARVGNIDLDIIDFIKTLLENMAVPIGVINVPEEMSPTTLGRMQKQWEQKYSGDGRGRTAIMEGGAKYEKISLTLSELEFSALTSMTEAQICAVFRISPILVGAQIGIEHSSYANYETAHKAFWSDRADLLCDLLADVVYRDIRDSYGTDTILPYFDKSNVTAYRIEQNEKRDLALRGFTAGLLGFQEGRKLWGLDPKGEKGDFVQLPMGGYPYPLGEDYVEPLPPQLPPEEEEPEPTEEPVEDEGAESEDEEKSIPTITLIRKARRDGLKRNANKRPYRADRHRPELQRAMMAELDREKRETLILFRRSSKTLDDAKFVELLQRQGYTWEKRINGILLPRLQGISESGLAWAMEELGIDKTPEGAEAILADMVRQHTLLTSSDIAKTTLKGIQHELSVGIREGLGTNAIKRNISATMLRDDPVRAARIAHTEVVHAYNGAAQAGYKSIGVVTKEWMVTADDFLCDWCQSMAAKGPIGIDSLFAIGGSDVTITVGEAEQRMGISRDTSFPPLHPNCRCDIIPGPEEIIQI